MNLAYLLRLGEDESSLFLANMPFDKKHFFLTDNRNDALVLERFEAVEIAAKYLLVNIRFVVEELRA